MRAYFDHAATSPIRPEVAEAYARALRDIGNPSSQHAAGRAARMRLEDAREELAGFLGCDPAEVLFTSGGTEGDNLAVQGILAARTAAVQEQQPRLLVSAVEHPAVFETAEHLEATGACELVELPVDADGRLDLDAAAAALAAAPERTALVSAMLANNEIGTIEPIAELAALSSSRGVPVHTDAVQAFGQIPVSMRELGVDALTVSGHKIGAPVGIGALALTRAITPVPIAHGGGQERRIRSGTLDVAGAIAFATAARLAHADLDEEAERLAGLRDRLIAGIETSVDGARLSGPRGEGRLPGSVHFSFDGCEGDSLLFLLDAAGFATSTGSACDAGVSRPSRVLMACGLTEDAARSGQRFTLGPETTETDVDALITAIAEAVPRARAAGMVSAAPGWASAAVPTGPAQATSPAGQAASPAGQAASPAAQATSPSGQTRSPAGQRPSPAQPAATQPGGAR